MSQFIEMFGVNPPKKKISEICDVHGGSTPARTNRNFWENGTVSWFTVEDINDQGHYIFSTRQHITELATKKTFVYPIDTVLICCTASVGEYAITKKEMASNQQFNGMMIRDKSLMNPEFLLYVASTLKDTLLNHAGKTTICFVSRSKLEEIEIPVPGIDDQNRFVAIKQQADKSEFDGFKSQFIEMFEFNSLNLKSPSNDFELYCYDDTSSATKIPAGEYLQIGRYAIYDQGQDNKIAGYTDNKQGLCNNYPAVLFGDHSRVIKYINEPFFIGADGVKVLRPKSNDILPEFLYYDLKYHDIPNTGYNRHFKYIKMIKLTKATIDEQKMFLSVANQADKSENRSEFRMAS